MKNIKSAHEDIEVILKRIKSIDFFPQLAVLRNLKNIWADYNTTIPSNTTYNPNMSVDLRNDLAVCSNNSSKEK
jgi:hypothetical protein